MFPRGQFLPGNVERFSRLQKFVEGFLALFGVNGLRWHKMSDSFAVSGDGDGFPAFNGFQEVGQLGTELADVNLTHCFTFALVAYGHFIMGWVLETAIPAPPGGRQC